jgi:DNA-binding transcriptional regulator PaaX
MKYNFHEKDKLDILNDSASVDLVIKLLAAGTITGTMLVAPNAIQILDRPFNSLFRGLDEREKRRKLSKLKSYLKTQGLVRGDYEHGLELTKKAIDRIKKIDFENLNIPKPDCWDKKWRMIMFDIPEVERYTREKFVDKLREIGMQLLQQSVWIHPYPCRDEILLISTHLDVDKWITFIVTEQIDNEDKLIARFKQTKVL